MSPALALADPCNEPRDVSSGGRPNIGATEIGFPGLAVTGSSGTCCQWPQAMPLLRFL
jgi:hypothetical protein